VSKEITWKLTDPLCKGCGGRILQSVSGVGMSPGGDPLWKCADCGKATTGRGPETLCWCGFAHRHNFSVTPYVCKSYKILDTYPHLIDAFLACGCDPKRGGEVGVMLEERWRAGVTQR
jgi:hypothetical protein